jgi:hypothetical protein
MIATIERTACSLGLDSGIGIGIGIEVEQIGMRVGAALEVVVHCTAEAATGRRIVAKTVVKDMRFAVVGHCTAAEGQAVHMPVLMAGTSSLDAAVAVEMEAVHTSVLTASKRSSGDVAAVVDSVRLGRD